MYQSIDGVLNYKKKRNPVSFSKGTNVAISEKNREKLHKTFQN